MSRTLTAWVLHQGSEANHFYTLYHKRPRVTVRLVRSERTGEDTPLYESPDPFVFNFCLHGTLRMLRVKLPLGSVTKLGITLEPEA